MDAEDVNLFVVVHTRKQQFVSGHTEVVEIIGEIIFPSSLRIQLILSFNTRYALVECGGQNYSFSETILSPISLFSSVLYVGPYILHTTN